VFIFFLGCFLWLFDILRNRLVGMLKENKMTSFILWVVRG